MLIVLIGTDTDRRHKRLETLVSQEEKAGADVRHYSDVSFNADDIRMSAGNTSLFGQKTVSVISGIGDSADLREAFEDIAEELAVSPDLFILSESAAPAAFVKRIKAAGVEPELFEQKEKKKTEAFNSFALTDAFSARNRSQAWALYRAAITAGVEPRELHGKLFWATKTMLLAVKSKNAAEAGVHPFVFGKSQASAKAFAPGELEKIATDLVVMVHESMLTGGDLETTLEAFILKALARPAAQ